MNALITGIGGQDGSYLEELLLVKGYEVHGLARASLESYEAIRQRVADVRPDECYHLAARSFVSYSPADEFTTLNVNINGTHHLLAALKGAAPACRVVFAGSSEMFGNAEESPQTERTRFRPRSIYGISKVAGCELTRHYRESLGMHASSAILFNHESPRRGLEFVTRKISHGVAQIAAGRAQSLQLGNLDAVRDWGHAREYVEAMWRMLQQDEPGDYVIATGKTHSVRDFAELAFRSVGLNYRQYVSVDSGFQRPQDARQLVGDASKAWQRLGWRAETEFEDLVREMVASDCRRLQAD